MENYFTTFNFYDEKGRRLSIFAKEVGNVLAVTVITCSKKDMFSKKKGRVLYKQWKEATTDKSIKVRPMGYIVNLVDAKSSKKEFINWCRATFYRMRVVGIEATAMVLVDKNDNVMEEELMKRVEKALRNGV